MDIEYQYDYCCTTGAKAKKKLFRFQYSRERIKAVVYDLRDVERASLIEKFEYKAIEDYLML